MHASKMRAFFMLRTGLHKGIPTYYSPGGTHFTKVVETCCSTPTFSPKRINSTFIFHLVKPLSCVFFLLIRGTRRLTQFSLPQLSFQILAEIYDCIKSSFAWIICSHMDIINGKSPAFFRIFIALDHYYSIIAMRSLLY